MRNGLRQTALERRVHALQLAHCAPPLFHHIRTSIDLDEIDGTPHEVVQNKATAAGNGIIIEDTSLDVEGADVGVNIRWIVENMEQFSGKKATWRVLLGVLDGSIDKVNIYEGIVEGIIVPSRGDSGFGFDPVFLPNGSDKTLAQEKGDEVSARYRAIQALVQNTPVAVADPIASADWKGKWQH